MKTIYFDIALFLLCATCGLAVIVFLFARRLGQLTHTLRHMQQQHQAHIIANGGAHGEMLRLLREIREAVGDDYPRILSLRDGQDDLPHMENLPRF